MAEEKKPYDVVFSSNIHDMVNLVNELYKEGYRPVGGIAASDTGFYQAMELPLYVVTVSDETVLNGDAILDVESVYREFTDRGLPQPIILSEGLHVQAGVLRGDRAGPPAPGGHGGDVGEQPHPNRDAGRAGVHPGRLRDPAGEGRGGEADGPAPADSDGARAHFVDEHWSDLPRREVYTARRTVTPSRGYCGVCGKHVNFCICPDPRPDLGVV